MQTRTLSMHIYVWFTGLPPAGVIAGYQRKADIIPIMHQAGQETSALVPEGRALSEFQGPAWLRPHLLNRILLCECEKVALENLKINFFGRYVCK